MVVLRNQSNGYKTQNLRRHITAHCLILELETNVTKSVENKPRKTQIFGIYCHTLHYEYVGLSVSVLNQYDKQM
jgi:hypothetical protein